MLEYAKLIRPERCILVAAAVWIGTLIAGAPAIPDTTSILGIASAFLIAAAGFSANDYFNARQDKLNRPGRSVAAGKMAALGGSAVLFAAGIAMAYFISFDAVAVAVIAAGLLVAYSVQLKRTTLIGNLLISGLAAIAFFFGGMVAGNHVSALPLTLMIFLSNTGREIYKTIDNALADRRYEKNSVAIKMGITNARIIANIFLIVAVIFSFIPYLLGMLGMTYLFFAIIADIILLLSAVIPVKYSSKLAAAGIVVGVVAFLAGAAAVVI